MSNAESLVTHIDRHRRAFNRLPLPLLTVALSGEILFANAAAEHTWQSVNGLNDPLTGKPVLSLIDEPGQEPDNTGLLQPKYQYVREVWDAANMGQSERVLVPIFSRGSGRRFIEVLPVFIHDPQGTIIGIELTAIDSTLRTIDDAENRLLIDIDTLTGLRNRRVFERQMELAQKRFERGKPPTSLILADLDEFKRYNDTHGHRQGDARIRETARLLTTVLRPGDVATRYGGEEFAVLLPDTSTQSAILVAERMRIAAEKVALGLNLTKQERGYIPGYTLSLGVATLSMETPCAELLLDGADKALYEAKHAGRNRVECWSSGNPDA